MSLLVTRPADVAAAAPTRTTRGAREHGSRARSRRGKSSTRRIPSLLTTSTIAFVNATTYTINGAGSFTYTPGADIDINGTRVQISGAPAAGDQFVIQSNVGGTGDNRNIQIADRSASRQRVQWRDEPPGRGGRVDHERGVANGRGSRISATCSSSCCNQSRDRLESVRGVNLDEEAADMLQFEQLYQAARK